MSEHDWNVTGVNFGRNARLRVDVEMDPGFCIVTGPKDLYDFSMVSLWPDELLRLIELLQDVCRHLEEQMNVAEQIELSEACNWSTGVAFGLADQLSVIVQGNVCIITDNIVSTDIGQLVLFASEVRDLIPALESALKELKVRGHADKVYQFEKCALPRET